MNLLEVLKALSSIVGMIGGILGFFVFIDNYILEFKPRFKISNRLFFGYKTEEDSPSLKCKSLESVILNIETINTRNKIGRIDDFAIRVYNPRATYPHEYMLYAENVLEELPSNTSKLDKVEANSFSSISILGRSNTNIVVEFKPEKYMGVSLNPEGSLKLDLIYYLPKKGWKTAGTFTPHYFKGRNDEEDPNGIVEYSLLDIAVTREEASNSLKRPQIGIYKGISGKYVGFYLMKPIWFLKRLVTYPLKVVKLIAALIEITARQISSHCLVLPLINLKSKSLPRLTISFGRTHLIDDTQLSLKKCRKNIEAITKKINAKADSKAGITTSDIHNGFSIRRGKLEVKFRQSGNGYIQVTDTGGYDQMFTFTMELVEFPFGIRLWRVNKKIMTLKSACIQIMDSFILLAH